MAQSRMAPPVLVSKDPTSLSLNWQKVPDAPGYRVRYRKADDPEWQPISQTTSVLQTETVKKKNLETGKGYVFSIKPELDEWAWSPQSDVFVPGASLSTFMSQLLPKLLVKQRGTVSAADALSNKVVGVYFSASWCGPCRAYTPVLADAYQEARRANKAFEVVFVSADRDENDFREYYMGHHPWLAVDYDSPLREELMAKFQVKGIPRLCVLKPSGEILQDNVGPVSASSIEGWVKACGL